MSHLTGIVAGRSSTPEIDPNSFSNVHEAYTKHLHLHWSLDFDKSVITGEALHTVAINQSINQPVKEFILDVSGLEIHSVHLYPSIDVFNQSINQRTHQSTGHAHDHADVHSTNQSTHQSIDDSLEHLSFRLTNPHPVFGSALHITLPESLNQSTHPILLIGIRYATTNQSTGLQWLTPSQTAGKVHPYLFSQFQAIHARTAFPCQDTPSNKFTYSAEVCVPRPLIALMSCPNLTHQSIDHPTNQAVHVFKFHQPIPIPSYLLAIAAGELERRSLKQSTNPKSIDCGVWSEPSMVDKGAFEFSETQQFVEIAESIAGPYVWKGYNLLLLPPSFPYGGMENVNLTFVTPTLLAGDRSLAGVVVHEIAHSWSGNLVTSHNWQHFWLNEGFTVFLERKVLKALKGAPAAGLDSIIGWRSLEDAVSRFGNDHPFTILNVHLTGTDPDDAFSTVPYEKGFNLLWALEQLIGEERMNEFLKAYFSNFAHSTVTTDDFKNFFLGFCSTEDKQKISAFDWDKWLHAPGLPEPVPEFDQSLMQDAEKLAVDWIEHSAELSQKPQNEHVDVHKWETDQIVVFLQRVRAEQKKAADPKSFAPIIEGLDRIYHFTSSRNAEIRLEWLELIIHAQMTSQYPAVMEFATEQGRMKFVRPLYRDLYQAGGAEGQTLAVNTFKHHRCNYHAICAKMVARDLKLEQ